MTDALMPVDACCTTMKVSRSAFDLWPHRQQNPTLRTAADAELGDLIAKAHEQTFDTYGWRRVSPELRLGLGREVTTSGCNL